METWLCSTSIPQMAQRSLFIQDKPVAQCKKGMALLEVLVCIEHADTPSPVQIKCPFFCCVVHWYASADSCCMHVLQFRLSIALF